MDKEQAETRFGRYDMQEVRKPVDERLKKLMERGLQISREIVEEGRQNVPTFLALSGDEVRVFMAPFRNEQEKVRLLKFLAMTFVVLKVDCYAVVTESWYATSDELGSDQMPSECPTRKEMLNIMGVERGNISWLQAMITRDDGPKVGEPEWRTSGKVGGRMAELLPPEDLPELPPWIKDEILSILKEMAIESTTLH
jgi:hypothetical protein